MIQVTLSFETIADAHACLGGMMIGAPVATLVPGTEPVAAAVIVPNELPVPPQELSDIPAEDAMDPAPKPKKKRAGGRPKGSKDTVVRKGTKAAEALITLDSLRDDLQSYANEHGFKAARDILQQFTGGNGQPIKRIPDLQTDDYAKFQRVLAKTPVEAEAEAS